MARVQNNSERGYILITLMLAFVLMAIALLAVIPEVCQQTRRDREKELVRRGTAYMRAIQRYHRRLNRYPSRIEDLENTNNVRYLRKPYKDPVNVDPRTGKERDFKFLHQQDFLTNSAVGPGLQGPGGSQNQDESGLQNQNNGGGNSDSSDTLNAQATTSISQSSSPNSSTSMTNSSGGFGLSGQVFGGSPIVGVVSTSKEKSILEFNKKNHYNDWYFIYDSSLVNPGLLVGPWQPGGIAVGGTQLIPPGQGISQPGAGQPSGPGVAAQGLPTQQNPNSNSPSN